MKTILIPVEGGRRLLLGMIGSALLLLSACSSRSTGASNAAASRTGARAKIEAVAAEDFWGSILRQLGGDRVNVTSVISDPAVDPHSYDPRPSDGASLASAKVVVVNGIGYDSWADKLLSASPARGRVVLNVGDLVNEKLGANPHVWYDPGDVTKVIDEMTADLKKVDPAGADYFDGQHAQFVDVALKPYDDARAEINRRYRGTPIGISESIFSGMAADLGLSVLTPPGFSNAIAEGNDPVARDKQTVDDQIARRLYKVLVFNSQNSTPDVHALVVAARNNSIPTVTVSETLTPKGATFQDWQVAQLNDLKAALAQATGK